MDKILEAIKKEIEKIVVKNKTAKSMIQQFLIRISKNDLDLEEQIEGAQIGYRLIRILKLKAYKNTDILIELRNSSDALWTKIPKNKSKKENIKKLALQLFEANNPGPTEKLILSVSPRVKEISEALIKLCQKHDIDFDIKFEEPHYLSVLLNYLDDERIKKLAKNEREKLIEADKLIGVRTSIPISILEEMDKDAYSLYKKYTLPFQKKIRSGEIFFTNTRVPTREDAKADQIEYNEYKKLYFQACDQPWEEIEKAQEIIIKKLNKTKTIRITNSDGTDVVFDVDGFTFCNSVVGKNIPGSEIFSAPKKTGVNGIIVSKEKHRYKYSPVIENITLEFKNGKCVRSRAETKQKSMNRILNIDDGSRYVGELAFGTNPHLRRTFTNIALSEKVTGSFHIAMGSCYTFEKYDDKSVLVNNGNKSLIHWDITTMLRGKEGKVYCDNMLVQDDGHWLIDGCDVINIGWQALPRTKRPDWWQKEFPKGYSS